MVIFVTQAFFLAAMDPYTPLKAAVMAGLLNLVGDVWLVNGLGWGIAGAAWATSASQVHPLCADAVLGAPTALQHDVSRTTVPSCSCLQSAEACWFMM